MTALHVSMLFLALLAVLWGASCDRTAGLKGQSNSKLVFHGIALDQDGKPLPGAEFVVDVEAIPAGWTFETRGKPHDHLTVTFTSGPDGKFSPKITGHFLRFEGCKRAGYRHLYDLDQGRGKPGENMFYQLGAWSVLWYKSDPEHPAVFVFVKDGVHKISALPCKGGWDSGGGKQWRLNKPGWPRKPSLNDVVYKPKASATTSSPTEN